MCLRFFPVGMTLLMLYPKSSLNHFCVYTGRLAMHVSKNFGYSHWTLTLSCYSTVVMLTVHCHLSSTIHCHDYPIILRANCECMWWGWHACAWH